MTEAQRGSTTLKFVVIAEALLFWKFLIGGNDMGWGENVTVTAGEFGIAFAAIMAPWLHREWRRSRYHNPDNE